MFARRLIYASLLGLTIVLGLVSRSSLVPVDSPVRLYAGDALWAMAVFWAIGILFPRVLTSRLAIFAIITAFSIELSQLYQADWINQLRSYRLGALILGHTFVWSDLGCYTMGVWLGASVDYYLIRKNPLSPPDSCGVV